MWRFNQEWRFNDADTVVNYSSYSEITPLLFEFALFVDPLYSSTPLQDELENTANKMTVVMWHTNETGLSFAEMHTACDVVCKIRDWRQSLSGSILLDFVGKTDRAFFLNSSYKKKDLL